MSQKNKDTQKGKYLTDFQRKLLQKNLQDNNLSKKYRQRIQIMMLADEGKTQSQICEALTCSVVTVRHWTLVANMGQAHNWQSNPLGRPKAVNEEYLKRLKELANQSPQFINIPGTEFKYPNKCWTAKKLAQHLAKEFGIELSDRHIRRLLQQMGLSTRKKAIETNSEDCKTQQKNRLVIGDLGSSKNLDNHDFWQFNPIQND